jgi:hypothetical protein
MRNLGYSTIEVRGLYRAPIRVNSLLEQVNTSKGDEKHIQDFDA